MEELKRGLINTILDKNYKKPTHNKMWGKSIAYYNSDIQPNHQALWYFNDGKSAMTTSYVQKIDEDENNLFVYTENSIYHIKKFTH